MVARARKCGALLLSLFLAGCNQGGTVRVLKLAYVLDTRHPVHQAMAYLGSRLEALSHGALRLDIFPAGQLGGEREYLESLQVRSLDLAKVSSSVLENFVPSRAVFSLPYLFVDEKHKWRVLVGPLGRRLLLEGERYWLRGLCYYETGSRNFYLVNRPVLRPEDLHGLKIRVMQSYWSIRTVNTLGGSATPIAFGELYTALQQGVVDGAENNIPTFYESRHFEMCKYLILDGHSSPPDALVISTHTWDRLQPIERRWLEQAAEESVAYKRRLWATAVEQDLAAVRRAGVQVIVPDVESFRQRVQVLYEELRHSHHDLYRLVEEIRSAAAPEESHPLAYLEQRHPDEDTAQKAVAEAAP
ncbi:MAG: TRAP transporter substrate-binding protein [candidate division KSB1 bacterium]|nr:TRAP transporter substrate-binding protein [candidate division KSB1 bacterium]